MHSSHAPDPRGLTLPASTWELPDLVQLYEAVRDRLKTGQAELDALHGGAGRVYLEGDQRPAETEEAGIQWGRTIVVPWQDLGGREYHPTQWYPVGVNLREEQGAVDRAGFNARYPLSVAHRLIYRLLDGWRPVLPTLRVGPFWLGAGPTDRLWDEQARLWYQTATWRTEILVP